MNDAEIALSRMTEDDIAGVLEIENVSFKDPWPRSVFERELQNEWSRSIVVKRDGLVAGYLIYWFVADEMHILNVAVNPAMRKTGLAETMLKHLIGEAGKLAVRFITLEVRKGNAAAQNLYKKYGFISAGMRRKYYSDDEDAVIMTLYLSSQGL
ncbi:MAG: ribosomal protein S18-alanine N-acetyltransferase [Deltaproteobacteria bacterium]|nr:ribosomal protein S18-alanine N-acetyltransferase [Deltaproteobacteria bacterium]